MIESRRIWLMDQRLIRAQKQGKILPFEENILAGYSNHNFKKNSIRIQNLTSQCTEKKIILKNGAEAILLIPNIKNSKVLVSFHGGPESYENTEIRYLGLYRALLRKGWTIAILNYRGSNKLKVSRKKTWKNWKASVTQDFIDLLSNSKIRSKSISLLGTSFGGTLALTICQSFEIKRCVLLSPLLDLKFQKDRAGREYKKWFDTRFSTKDYNNFSFENLTLCISTKTLCLCSQKDEVLANSMNYKLINKSKMSQKVKVITQQTSHFPKTYSSANKRYRSAFTFLMEK